MSGCLTWQPGKIWAPRLVGLLVRREIARWPRICDTAMGLGHVCSPVADHRQSTEARNMDSSTVSVVAVVAANASVAATKFIAAAATGSGAMLAEAIHSLVDTDNSSLMLLGIWLSRRQS